MQFTRRLKIRETDKWMENPPASSAPPKKLNTKQQKEIGRKKTPANHNTNLVWRQNKTKLYARANQSRCRNNQQRTRNDVDENLKLLTPASCRTTGDIISVLRDRPRGLIQVLGQTLDKPPERFCREFRTRRRKMGKTTRGNTTYGMSQRDFFEGSG